MVLEKINKRTLFKNGFKNILYFKTRRSSGEMHSSQCVEGQGSEGGAEGGELEARVLIPV